MHTHRRCRFRALSSSLARTRRLWRRRLRPAAFPRRSILRKFKEATTFQRPVSWLFPDHVPRSIFTGPFSLQDYVGASGLRRMVCIRTGDADSAHFLLLLHGLDVAGGDVESRSVRSLLRKFKEATTFQRPVSWLFPDHVPRSILAGPSSLQDYVGTSGLRRIACIRTGNADSAHFLLLLHGLDVAGGVVFIPQRSRDDRSCANSRKRRLSSVRCHGFPPTMFFGRHLPVRFRFRIT